MAGEKKSVADSVQVSPHDESLGANAVNAFKKVPVVGKGYATIADNYKKFAAADDAGDVAMAAGSLVTDGAAFVASCTADIAGFVLDPVGWLVSNGLNFLIELIQPLQDLLHMVTGDGPALNQAATNFTNIGNGFVKLAEDWVETGDKALVEWKEDAGEAARKALAEFAVGIQGIGSAAGSLAQTLQMWSMVMTVVEELVKSIISELVSALIYIWLPALAASIVSFGSSVAAAMTTTLAKVGSALSKITAKLGKLGKLLDDFVKFLAKWTTKLIENGKKLHGTERLLPGEAKIMSSAAAKVAGKRGAATMDALKDIGKSIPGKISGQITGIDPSSAASNPGKAAIDNIAKKWDYVEAGKSAAERGKIGGGQDPEQTRENLDI
ncbi:hypothetical protein [Thermocrispum municipale]|jgi:hypothetical protein|uniref:hypothetical protein n=1 Tax=Thermocrispum municipale TaxID=37926 RepID=UPI0003F737D9|nr:hypothetical protein [Thermocrispum municipale]